MGWSLETKEEKGVTKYRIWTSNSDSWITEWSTKEEIIKFLFWHRFYEFVDSFIKDDMTFPHHWGVKGENTIMVRKEEAEAYFKLMSDAHDSEDEYETTKLKKFTEIMKAHGFELKMEDKRGYGFDSKEDTDKIGKESVSDVVSNDPKYLLGVLRNIERSMSKAERKRKSNVSIVKDYLMCHTSKGGRTSSYEMCEYLGIDADAYTFN